MKVNLKKLALISLSICALVPLSFGEIAPVKAESLSTNIKQTNQRRTAPYLNHPNLAGWKNACKQRVSNEYDMSLNDALSLCNCIVNELYSNPNDYTYRNYPINSVARLNWLSNEVRNGNEEAQDVFALAGMMCYE
jgi:hypothetical protein